MYCRTRTRKTVSTVQRATSDWKTRKTNEENEKSKSVKTKNESTIMKGPIKLAHRQCQAIETLLISEWTERARESTRNTTTRRRMFAEIQYLFEVSVFMIPWFRILVPVCFCFEREKAFVSLSRTSESPRYLHLNLPSPAKRKIPLAEVNLVCVSSLSAGRVCTGKPQITCNM